MSISWRKTRGRTSPDDKRSFGGDKFLSRYVLVVLLCLSALGILFLFADRLATKEAVRYLANWSRKVLLKKLGHEHPFPHREHATDRTPVGVLYILGGNQRSLDYKCRMAGRLYRKGLVSKVLVSSNPGITEFSPAIRRNLTNNEWLLSRIEEAGVAGRDVEFLSYPPSFFGTFGEARAVSHIVSSRGIQRLLLVSSQHHMMRVWLSFSYFIDTAYCELYTYGSEEKATLFDLFMEYCKFLFYKYTLLPSGEGCWSFAGLDQIRSDPNSI